MSSLTQNFLSSLRRSSRCTGFSFSSTYQYERCALIGIGGHLAVPPLPHHRAYGSVPRRFDRVKLGQRHGVGGDRVSRNSGCAELVGPPGVRRDLISIGVTSVGPPAAGQQASWRTGKLRRRRPGEPCRPLRSRRGVHGGGRSWRSPSIGHAEHPVEIDMSSEMVSQRSEETVDVRFIRKRDGTAAVAAR